MTYRAIAPQTRQQAIEDQMNIIAWLDIQMQLPPYSNYADLLQREKDTALATIQGLREKTVDAGFLGQQLIN